MHIDIFNGSANILNGSISLNNEEVGQSAENTELAGHDNEIVSNSNPVSVPAELDSEADKVGTAPVETDESPNWQSLDHRHVLLERLGGLIFAAIVLVGGAIGLLVWWLTGGIVLGWWISLGGYFLVTAMLFWSAVYWPAIAHRHARWRLDETGLEIHRGVFWQHQISVPLARLQHADVSQGPLQRRFGLGKLTVHTAGTANASVELDGLAFEVAGWLRDRLITQRETLDVV